jgi:hypothetical protein
VRTEATGDRCEEAWAWVAVIAVTILTSAIAFLVTDARCGGLGVVLSKSAYCRALDGPGLASTPPGIALEFALFGLPSAVALLAAVRWAVTHRRSGLTGVTVFCAANVALSLLLLAVAHAQYMPVD